jgi:hypothetical protein
MAVVMVAATVAPAAAQGAGGGPFLSRADRLDPNHPAARSRHRLERLEVLVNDDDEPSAAFLRPLRELDVRLSNLRAATTARRAALVRAWLVPSRIYMVQRYGIRHGAMLPFWHLYRILSRLPRWLVRYRGTKDGDA